MIREHAQRYSRKLEDHTYFFTYKREMFKATKIHEQIPVWL